MREPRLRPLAAAALSASVAIFPFQGAGGGGQQSYARGGAARHQRAHVAQQAEWAGADGGA